MLKNEFEKLVGKEVDDKVFDIYNKMYMSMPQNVDKFDFVKMLNIDAIPESEASIERKRKNHDAILKYAVEQAPDIINEIYRLEHLKTFTESDEQARKCIIQYKKNRLIEINELCGTDFKVIR